MIGDRAHVTRSLLLVLIALVFAVNTAPYTGPSNVCVNFNPGVSVLSGWCSTTNPFGQRPKLLTDYPLYSALFRFTPICKGNGDAYDKCYSVIAIRAFEVQNGEETLSIATAALATGEIYGVNINTYNLIYYVERRNDNEEMLFMDNEDNFIATVAQQKTDSLADYTIRGYDGSPTASPHKLWETTLSASVEGKIQSIRVFKAWNGIYTVALLTQNLYNPQQSKLHFVTKDGSISWALQNDQVKFDIVKQYGNITAPHMRITTRASYRDLVLLYSPTTVRIVAYTADLTIAKRSPQLVIDFRDTVSQQAKKSTFFVSDIPIESCALVGEMIRRPRFSDPMFDPSQNMQLAIVTYNNYTDNRKLILHPVPELRLVPLERIDYDYDTAVALVQPVIDHSLELIVPLDGGQAVTYIKSRFIDAPAYLNSIPSYDLVTGDLNMYVLCEAYRESPYWDPTKQTDQDYFKCYQLFNKYATLNETSFFAMGDDTQLVTYLDAFMNSYWQTQLFMTRTDSIEFVSLVPRFDEPSRLAVGPVINKIPALLGNVRDLGVSDNGQHVFMAITRHRFELESIDRYRMVCQKLQQDPDNIFLKAFKPYCQQLTPGYVDMNQFGLTISSCIDTVFCPGVKRTIMKTTDFPDGKFLLRANALVDCPEGSYCHSGIRFDCSPGFSCPHGKLAAPLACSQNPLKTCYNVRLVKPADCPPGALCTTQYLPPIMTPDGYYLKKMNQDGVAMPMGIEPCEIGYYCPFGREAIFNQTNNGTLNDLLCPAKTYCANVTVLTPTICNMSATAMEYCPPGTSTPQLCPAGFYCTNLDLREPCHKSQYCPEGSFASQVCPAGYYCPTPSQKIICPKDNYCTQGSVEPKPCNFFFSDCKPGSTADNLTYVGIALLIVIILFVTILWIIYLVVYRVYRHQSNMRRKGIQTSIFSSVRPGEDDFDKSLLVDISMQSDMMSYGSMAPDNQLLTRTDKFTVDLRFEELGLVLRTNGVKVLKGVSGEIKHGQLTAVMGMSGAGKSTFITTLAGRAYYGNRVGKIYINGKEESLKKFNKRVGFVPQEEIMLRTMTVEETLYFAARTRLDYKKTRHEVQAVVDNVIRVLRLEDVRHSVIGDEESRGISGGQRKRVNVAIELVADPYVLFLDEPTSGLDSASSKEVCAALQLIAQSGITVITVIHQPRKEIFDMFSHLLLLGQGGRTVYLGPVQEAVTYFENLGFKCPDRVNPADFLIDVTAGNIASEGRNILPQELPELWIQYETEHGSPTVAKEVYQTGEEPVFIEPSLSYVAQFWMCMQRAFIQQLRNIQGLFIDNFLILFAATALGVMYANKVYEGPPPKAISDLCPAELQKICTLPQSDPLMGQSSMVLLALALTSAMASLKAFGKEKVVFLRESETGLSTFCYFWAKDIALLPSNLLAPAVFLSIYYTTISPRAPFIDYYWVLLLVNWCSHGLGFIVSICVKPHVAQLAAVVIVFLFNIFSGSVLFLPDLDKMFPPINYIAWVTYLMYGLQGLYVTEIQYFKNIYDISKSLDIYGFRLDRFPMIAGVMVALGFIFRFAAWFLLNASKPGSYMYRLASWITNYKHHFGRLKARFNKPKTVLVAESVN